MLTGSDQLRVADTASISIVGCYSSSEEFPGRFENYLITNQFSCSYEQLFACDESNEVSNFHHISFVKELLAFDVVQLLAA